jgi:hypothetical protein
MPELLAALDAFLQGAPPLRRAGRWRRWQTGVDAVRVRRGLSPAESGLESEKIVAHTATPQV